MEPKKTYEEHAEDVIWKLERLHEIANSNVKRGNAGAHEAVKAVMDTTIDEARALAVDFLLPLISHINSQTESGEGTAQEITILYAFAARYILNTITTVIAEACGEEEAKKAVSMAQISANAYPLGVGIYPKKMERTTEA